MRHEDLRIFLEHGGNHNGRHILLNRSKSLNHIAAHDEFEAACGQHEARIGLRPALDDLHLKAIFGISAVSDRLVKAAMFGLCQPIRAEAHLVGSFSAQSAGQKKRRCPPDDFHPPLRPI